MKNTALPAAPIKSYSVRFEDPALGVDAWPTGGVSGFVNTGTPRLIVDVTWHQMCRDTACDFRGAFAAARGRAGSFSVQLPGHRNAYSATVSADAISGDDVVAVSASELVAADMVGAIGSGPCGAFIVTGVTLPSPTADACALNRVDDLRMFNDCTKFDDGTQFDDGAADVATTLSVSPPLRCDVTTGDVLTIFRPTVQMRLRDDAAPVIEIGQRAAEFSASFEEVI